MRELADIVLFLRDAYRPEDLVKFIDNIRTKGSEALGPSGLSDLRTVAERRLQDAGVLSSTGVPNAVRASWLVVVADILNAAPAIQMEPQQVQPLAFTVPVQASDLIRPARRIDLLIGLFANEVGVSGVRVPV